MTCYVFKFCLPVLLATILLSSHVLAAKITSEKIKAVYVKPPVVSLADQNLNTLEVVLGMKEIHVIKKKLATSTSDTVCNALNKKLGIEKPYTNHFYEMTLSSPEGIYALSKINGAAIYTDHTSVGTLTDRFGTGCMSSKKSLDDALTKKNMKYKPQNHFNEVRKQAIANTRKKLIGLVSPQLISKKYKIYSAKGPEYADINKALRISVTAYKAAKGKFISEAGKKELKQANKIWEKALEEKDIGNKNARINKKLSEKIHHNVALNSMMTGDFDKAEKNYNEIQKIRAGNTFRGGSNDPNAGLQTVSALRTQTKTFDNPQAVKIRRKELKTFIKKLKFRLANEGEYAGLQAQLKEKHDQNESKKAEAIVDYVKQLKSGNRFESQIVHTAFQGYTLMISSWGSTFNSFPVEICDLTQLNNIALTSNKIESIPPDIAKLENLKVLNLKGNQLKNLPAEIGELKNLEKLLLSKNQISEIPEEIGKLSKLKTLDLRKNKIPKTEKARLKKLLPKTKIKL